MQYTNRPASDTDYEVIASFPQNSQELFFMFPSGTFPITAGQLIEKAQDRHYPTVIEHEGEVVAYANLYDCEAGSHCWLGNVIVSPAFRSQGAGSYLLRTMMEKARDLLKAKRFLLVCHNINTPALLFYYKHGFVPFDLKTMANCNGDRIIGIKLGVDLQ